MEDPIDVDNSPESQEQRKRRIVESLSLGQNVSVERNLSVHPIDVEIRRIQANPQLFDPNNAQDYVARIAETRKLNPEEVELFHAFKGDFVREFIKASEYGRRFIPLMSINWTMIDAPLVPNRVTGNLNTRVEYLTNSTNLIRLGAVIQDFVMLCGFEVVIEVQNDIVSPSGYVELRQLPSSADEKLVLDYKATIGQLYAVSPSWKNRFKVPLPPPPVEAASSMPEE